MRFQIDQKFLANGPIEDLIGVIRVAAEEGEVGGSVGRHKILMMGPVVMIPESTMPIFIRSKKVRSSPSLALGNWTAQGVLFLAPILQDF